MNRTLKRPRRCVAPDPGSSPAWLSILALGLILGAPAAALALAQKSEPAEVVDLGSGTDGDDREDQPIVRWEIGLEREDEEVAQETELSSVPTYELERIEITGNRKTLRHVILRYLEINSGETFKANDPRLETARYRLLASGLFHEVDLSLSRGSQRGKAILTVRVDERNTILVRQIVAGFSELTPYGSLDVGDHSFFGTKVDVSTAAVFSKKQYGYRLRLSDDHFLRTDFGLHIEGLYAHARDFFGHESVCVDTCPTVEAAAGYDQFAVMRYDRAGLRLGTSYALRGGAFVQLTQRIEEVSAHMPPAASHVSFGETRPIVFGHLQPGHSIVSSLTLGIMRDTRDNIWLPSAGNRTAFEVEVATELIGSNYEFSKFTLSHDEHFPLGRKHSLKLGFFAGLIMGDAPFFDQFFVGDFSAFVPSRVLGLNFSHLQPNLLKTAVQEMRYEDLSASIGLEYSIPLYRGHGFFYGVNAYFGLGAFVLASRQHLRTETDRYTGFHSVPMDLTVDLGIRVDTHIGPVVLNLANLFRLIPSVGERTAQE